MQNYVVDLEVRPLSVHLTLMYLKSTGLIFHSIETQYKILYDQLLKGRLYQGFKGYGYLIAAIE